MIKKSLFKKITALALSLCLVSSSALVYAGDAGFDEEPVFVEEYSENNEASEDAGYAGEEELVFDESENDATSDDTASADI